MATTTALLDFYDNRYFEASCAGKDRYPTEQAAEQVARMYRARRIKHHTPKVSEELFHELETYWCNFCNSYHRGHAR